MMKNEFIPYEQALALKEMGFDEECLARYYFDMKYPMLRPDSSEVELKFEIAQFVGQSDKTILAPLYQQAFRWFREKGLDKTIIKIDNMVKKSYYFEVKPFPYYVERGFKKYEEAELACLRKLIELLKSKQR